MAENSGTDPTVDSNVVENAASDGTMIVVTVKTPKDKEEIAISEDSSVAQVFAFIYTVSYASHAVANKHTSKLASQLANYYLASLRC